MSANDMQTGQTLRGAFAPVLRVLKQLGGHFTFTDEDGEQFVIARQQDFVGWRKRTEGTDKQLALPAADAVARAVRRNVPMDLDDEVLQRINRDIAISHWADDERSFDDLGLGEHRKLAPDRPTPPPVRVRFEPIKGDLPPELQE